ncbi:MAG: hypothetical protein ING20_11790 [Burkholderiales bacterium]|nr:hypothetical protein [Burkholderiales bacterium]
MSKWVLVPEGITEAVDAAKDFYELYKRTVVSGCTPMEQLRFVAALKFFESMLNAAPSPDKQPVAWYVFDKRTQKHWYTNKSVNTAGYYAKEYSYREADGSPSMLVVPLYEHPPVAPAPDGAITNEGTKSDVEPVAWMNKYPDGHREFHNGKDNAADYAVPVYAQPTDVADLVKALREVTDGIEHGFTDRKADVVIANAYAVLTKWEGK